jgi:molecular chaperone DnaK
MKLLIDARSRIVLALAIALASGVALAACSGSSTTSPGAASSPASASSTGATSAAAVDPCLVGTWTTVGETQNSPANDEQITYSGGNGEAFTIDAQGAVTIDTHAAKKVVFVSAGETFTRDGRGHGPRNADHLYRRQHALLPLRADCR